MKEHRDGGLDVFSMCGQPNVKLFVLQHQQLLVCGTLGSDFKEDVFVSWCQLILSTNR